VISNAEFFSETSHQEEPTNTENIFPFYSQMHPSQENRHNSSMAGSNACFSAFIAVPTNTENSFFFFSLVKLIHGVSRFL